MIKYSYKKQNVDLNLEKVLLCFSSDKLIMSIAKPSAISYRSDTEEGQTYRHMNELQLLHKASVSYT